MARLTVIGRGVRIRGRVTGEADLSIEGHIEGDVAVSGDVTIEASGLVGANVTGHVIVVRGAVRGDLTADEVVRLEDGARVVGDIRAPRIAVAKGALVRGLVQTGSGSARAPQQATRAKGEAPAVRRAPAPVAAAAPVTPKAAPPPPAPRSAPVVTAKAAPVVARTVAKGPPPPVVPALKKGAKAALKKKAT